MLSAQVRSKTEDLHKFAEANDISYLALFGSHARGEQNKHSDIDMLVSFKKKKGLLAFIKLERQLSDLLGAKVDLVTTSGLSKYIRPYIVSDLTTIYEQKS